MVKGTFGIVRGKGFVKPKDVKDIVAETHFGKPFRKLTKAQKEKVLKSPDLGVL